VPALRGLESLFARVQKPARYTGGEWNSTVKDWDSCDVRVAFAYPDLYDIGMSNMGLGILYDIVNRREGMLAERVFAPWSDMEAVMRAEGVPLWSLETRHPLSEFDVIGFSLSYEGTYTNILNMLDLAGLPVRAEERTDAHPLIVCGGSGALNPDALADFVDVFALGDGEETIAEIVDFVREWKRRVAAAATRCCCSSRRSGASTSRASTGPSTARTDRSPPSRRRSKVSRRA
jgi:radical SAM superfamily enzyme YgiQ (UPF0313 family)